MAFFIRSLSGPISLSSQRLSPALSHPAWWAALALLIINDHVFKGAGWLPGWLTGKVSDFAFLLVAPALVHSALPARARGGRAIAILAIAIPFFLGKVLPSCTHLLETAVRAVGVTWRLWTDPTDLIALAVLPITWTLLARRSSRRPSRDLLPRAAVTIGALACVATSAIWNPQVRPFVRNGMKENAQVQVRWLLKYVACDTPLSEIARSLQQGDLSTPISIQLEAEAFAAVDVQPRPGGSPIGTCSNDPLARNNRFDDQLCPVVLVATAGLTPVLTRTRGMADDDDGDSVCAPGMWPEHRPAGEIRIEDGANGALGFVAGHQVEMIEFAIPASWSSSLPPAGSCQAIATDYAMSLTDGQSCGADADCRPVSDGSCDAVNIAAAGSVDAAISAYAQAGCAHLASACEQGHPAICDTGRCAIDCPTVPLNGCPVRCGTLRRTGDACNDAGPCLNEDGNVCSCAYRRGQGAVECELPVAPAGCRTWCR